MIIENTVDYNICLFFLDKIKHNINFSSVDYNFYIN